MGDLDRLGIGLAVDGFGAGYSSLSCLRELPVSTLKIDRSFLTAGPNGEPDLVCVNAATQFAHALGCKVVGEGVETRSQLAALRSLDCDAWQGYLCTRPLADPNWSDFRSWRLDETAC